MFGWFQKWRRQRNAEIAFQNRQLEWLLKNMPRELVTRGGEIGSLPTSISSLPRDFGSSKPVGSYDLKG